jgi:hypothetical protein
LAYRSRPLRNDGTKNGSDGAGYLGHPFRKIKSNQGIVVDLGTELNNVLK